MAARPDLFRDFGIVPDGLSAPPERVRAYFSWGRVLGQYLATCLMSGFGIGVGLALALSLPAPTNALAASAAVVGFGFLVIRATRNDYLWVELEGDKLRAKHLYTGRIVVRSIEEIEDLLTLVFLARTKTVRLTDVWIGRVRGIMIRFYDQRTPIQVSRADPAMTNAKELIEAVIYRLAKHTEVETEVIEFEGRPLIRRLHRRPSGG